MSAPQNELLGWELLTHGGLLVDAPRLRKLADDAPKPLKEYAVEGLRRHYLAFQQERQKTGEWVTYVLEQVCGFGSQTGYWQRGNEIGTEWSRTSLTGEAIRPRQLWRGSPAGLLPVFVDEQNDNIGRGKGRKAVSNVLQWMRAFNLRPEVQSNDRHKGATHVRLALLTNGRQWRLLYAGLDAEAWAEWDAERWFEEGALGKQVDMLRLFFAPEKWQASANDQASVLLQAVQDSRKGQADLSALLGERVREGVEMLLQAHGEQLKNISSEVNSADIYRAAVRVVMRMVVVLFAESRDLLPRSNSLYHRAYGLNGLLEELEKHGGGKGERIAHVYGAWPRVLALFRLVFQGSPHPALPIHAYGGELFELGEKDSQDGLKQALWILENASYSDQIMSDLEVRKLLERISRTKVKVRQGKTATMVSVPVDFSDLGSEYIGILYEGLLDFELKAAPEGDPMVFLAVGNEPVLPLSRLEAMTDAELKSLLEKMKDSSKKEDGEEDSEAEEPGVESGELREESESDDEDSNEDESEVESEHYVEDVRHSTRSRAEQWALRVVKLAGLVKKPKGTLTPEKQAGFEQDVARKARALVKRVVLPGEWFLVRWGGTRKGAGTFYTRPGLAVPTVHRTLRPLAYDAPLGADGKADTLAHASLWTPKKPEEILALKVCDPACGSGSFPVAALRFLTEAVYASLHFHQRIHADADRSFVALLQEKPGSVETLGTELIPCRPDDETFDARLKARLRRHVVERCIYGVDLDPLGVELCRLALWVETMDHNLPFSFLDHKVKCGNGLVGAWFDQFQHYPVMAWKNREAGDKGHSNGVHFQKEAGTKLLKEWVKDKLTPDMALYVGQWSLFQGDIQDISIRAHTVGLDILESLHSLPVQDSGERARIYRREWLENPEYKTLRRAMDLWCACWFWPAEHLEIAPMPTKFANADEATLAQSQKIAAQKRFFHWELEFPDVFRKGGDGFDAVIGNPPWETLQPTSKEFFSNIDPLYRTYGKQEAIAVQTQLFGKEDFEKSWLVYTAGFASDSNWMKFAATPFGDPNQSEDNSARFSIYSGANNKVAHDRWRGYRSQTKGFANPEHPFQHRGEGKAYTYKLFLEQGYAMLKEGGRMGMIIPSGIYSDLGTHDLRKLFLDRCNWEWLFGFENRNGIFAIHRSFKFNPMIVQRGGKTEVIHTAFMRRELTDWEDAEAFAVDYRYAQVARFSPKSLAILEIQGVKDLEILEKIYSNSVLLGDQGPNGWGVKYAQGDFNMTSDSKLFPPRPKWEEKGYQPDEYSRWLLGAWRPIAELWAEMGVAPLADGERWVAQPPYDTLPVPRAEIAAGVILSRNADEWIQEEDVEDVALPLYEGRMIGQFDFSQKGWVGGKGRTAVWNEIEVEQRFLAPQFLMQNSIYLQGSDRSKEPKLIFMDVGSSTNSRSMIAAIVPDMPAGNKVPKLTIRKKTATKSGHEVLAVILNSFVYDFQLRARFGGLSLNYFILEETALVSKIDQQLIQLLTAKCLAVAGPDLVFSQWWRQLETTSIAKSWRNDWAITSFEKLRFRCLLDAICSALFGLGLMDLEWILKDADLPDGNGTDPKGFWRIDKDKDPELRHTVLTLVAFHDLQAKIQENGGDRDKGIEAFLNQNDGEGWMLPETLRLADYGLGHDDRALEHQPVASRLGPRYYNWQLAQTAEESWKECHLHARNLLGEEGYQQLLERIAAEKRGEKYEAPDQRKDDKNDRDDQDPQLKLF